MNLPSARSRAGAVSRCLLGLAAIGLAGCGSPGPPKATAGQPVWLCQPGTSPDPCTADLDAEVQPAGQSGTEETAAPAANPRFDCFYVYPTVSAESGLNADLAIQPAEIKVAEEQASRFSTVCRVWAPMYRQVTLSGLFTGASKGLDVAYDSLLADWSYYLEHDNGGRPVIFIGHSQGAAMLIRLIAEQIDPDPIMRGRTVVAILAGGNLQVPAGATVGATFKHIPLCTSLSAPGCVIAYSAFGSEPPSDAFFGRPGQGVSLMSGQLGRAGQQVACVNPAAVGGGSGELSPYFRRTTPVPWITYPNLYRARCESADGATWLQVDSSSPAGDNRPVVAADMGPAWGYHVYDVNLALGDLVDDVAALESAYQG